MWWWWLIPIAILAMIVAFINTPDGKGIIGEISVRIVIGKTKEDSQYVLNNYMLCVDGKSSQIDHIVINPRGVFVIETKNYSGRIYGDDYQREWTQTLSYGKVKNKLYNPIQQNYTHICRLKTLLPETTPVKSVIVFVQGNTGYLKTDKVIGIEELYSVLNSEDDAVITLEEMRSLYDLLVSAKESCSVTAGEHIAEIEQMKENIDNNICPRCGAELVLRHGKYGEFYGCSKYPECKFKKST